MDKITMGSEKRSAFSSKNASRGNEGGCRLGSIRATQASRPFPSARKRLCLLTIGAIVLLVFSLCVGGCGSRADSQTDSQADSQTDFKTGPSEQTVKEPAAKGQVANAAPAYCTPRTEEERRATSDSVNDVIPEDQVVYLTFDDGPSPNTPRILDILNTYGVKATWFVKSDQPDVAYVKDIWEHGNQVAIHTWSHVYTDIYASSSAFWNDIDHAGSVINDYLGFTPTLMRFPGGSLNSYNTGNAQELASQVHERSWHYFDWNVSSGDGGTHTADEIFGYVSEAAQEKHSCCILMHDSSAKDTTVEALPRIIEFLIDEGYTFDVLTADSFGYHF